MTPPERRDLAMTTAELQDILDTSFSDGPSPYEVTAVEPSGVTIRIDPSNHQIRPGGTVSGPTMMGLADCAAWLATLAVIGPVLLAVTSSLDIHFLTKPQPGAELRATGSLLRLGRRQSVSTVEIVSQAAGSKETLVAHATVVYAIPPSTA